MFIVLYQCICMLPIFMYFSNVYVSYQCICILLLAIFPKFFLFCNHHFHLLNSTHCSNKLLNFLIECTSIMSPKVGGSCKVGQFFQLSAKEEGRCGEPANKFESRIKFAPDRLVPVFIVRSPGHIGNCDTVCSCL